MKRIKQWIEHIKERNSEYKDFDYSEWDKDLSEEV